jgi:hypothetical protein
MPIVPSRHRQIQELIDALSAPRAAARESAAARLEHLGPRAVPSLVAALRSAEDPAARGHLRRVLESIDDPRARRALRDADADPAQPRESPEQDERSLTSLEAAVARLPAGAASVPALHDALRAAAARAATGDGWSLRLRIHQELAARDSRIALYDLREMLERRPLRDRDALLDLVSRIGDQSLVPVLARLAHDMPAALPSCVDALRALIRRERLKKTRALVNAVRAEHRAVLEGLWRTASRRA